MKRYFLELSYKGTGYAGFQRQENAITIQMEVENALHTILRNPIALTGSSRTDAGVHAMQNYFHFDTDLALTERLVYNLNALLPAAIAVHRIVAVDQAAHSRFDAVSREYRYHVVSHKRPFLADRAYFFPYKLDLDVLQRGAELLKEYTDFTSFSKRNTQVKTFQCRLEVSQWVLGSDGVLQYYVRGNRFLRGMVRGLTGTMLKLGRGKIGLDEFVSIIEARDCTRADFAVPPQGLFLEKVNYPEGYFEGFNGA